MIFNQNKIPYLYKKLFLTIINQDTDKLKILVKNTNLNLNYQYKILSHRIRNYTPLMLAIQNQSIDMVNILLNESVERLNRNIADLDGNSAIIWAILLTYDDENEKNHNKYEILRCLLNDFYVDKGFIKKINKSDPMTCALWIENMTTIEILLDYSVPVYWDHLDSYRRNFYNKIVDDYYRPYEPFGKGYKKLLKNYSAL